MQCFWQIGGIYERAAAGLRVDAAFAR